MLTAFTAGLLLITISELGDKTFFIAVILSLRHAKSWVFTGVTAALAVMTIISVLVGRVVAILPENYLNYGEIILFFCFGIKLLYDAVRMSDQPGNEEEQAAVEMVGETKLPGQERKNIINVLLKSFSLTFVAEWGDRTQIATIGLAATYQPWGVVTGAILGHAICAAIAISGGAFLARRLSERAITAIGGTLFLLFSAIAYWENFLVYS